MTFKTTFKIYQPGAAQPEVREIELPQRPGFHALDELLRPILGGALEHVGVLFDNKRCDMFVNELGAVEKLDRNEEATKIYRTVSLQRNSKLNPETLPYIYGTAVLFERRVWF